MWSLNLFPDSNYDAAPVWKVVSNNCMYILAFQGILCFQVLHLKFGPGVKLVHLFSSKDIIIIALGGLCQSQISPEIRDPRSSAWGGGL